MSRQVRFTTACLLLLFVISCVLLVVVGEQPKCSLEHLVLDQGKVPAGWRNDLGFLPPALETLGAHDAYLMTMKREDSGGISHGVYRYRNRWLAAFHFWFDSAVFFPSASTDWTMLEQADRLSLHADQQRIQCGVAHDYPLGDSCAAVLRYGPFISDFGASIGEKGDITVEEFLEIVTLIDERFAPCMD